MKIGMTCLMWLLAVATQAQTKAFSVSPIPPSIQKVNGLTLGFGHYNEPDTVQTINGINVDIFPFSMLIFMHRNPNAWSTEKIKLRSNGLNIGISGFDGGVIHKGVSLAVFNITNELHGVGIHASYNSSTKLNGIHISLIGNFTRTSNGLNIGIYNGSQNMNGVQIGLVNASVHMKGLQIGLFNRTDALTGLQLGFINVNGKRTLPFINF